MSALRKPVNLSLDSELLVLAREYEVNISRAAEAGLRAAISRATTLAWQAENAAALESSNQYAASHGLPVAGKRPF
jgi:antitoxin CcdA